jgi:orotidine-5'-phosphate decarboxylase
LREIGIEHDVSTQVSRLAMLAMENGLDGVVASALEAPAIRHAAGKRDFLIVSPGVRLKDASNDDQRRVTTPGAAVASGSDFVVIGRPITGAADMLKAVEQITADIAATS